MHNNAQNDGEHLLPMTVRCGHIFSKNSETFSQLRVVQLRYNENKCTHCTETGETIRRCNGLFSKRVHVT